MPDLYDRFEENVPGKYYVTKVCICCAICSEIAPDNSWKTQMKNCLSDTAMSINSPKVKPKNYFA